MTGCSPSERIFLYLEDQLGRAERRALEEHLERCPVCRAALEERRALHEAFTSLPPLEVPPGFADRVMAGIPRQAGAFPGRAAALAAAALALAAAAAALPLLMGRSLADLFVVVNQALAAGLGGALPLLAKALKSARVAVELLLGFLSALADGLGILSSAIRPESIALLLGLGLALAALMLLGAKKLLALGERA